jgi:hypothetical protein
MQRALRIDRPGAVLPQIAPLGAHLRVWNLVLPGLDFGGAEGRTFALPHQRCKRQRIDRLVNGDAADQPVPGCEFGANVTRHQGVGITQPVKVFRYDARLQDHPPRMHQRRHHRLGVQPQIIGPKLLARTEVEQVAAPFQRLFRQHQPNLDGTDAAGCVVKFKHGFFPV